MASQVLSGSSNVSYTNNTGQNVRIVINFMAVPRSMSWAGASISGRDIDSFSAIGRNLAFIFTTPDPSSSANAYGRAQGNESGAPTELMLAPGQTFSAVCGPYNIVVIPEAG